MHAPENLRTSMFERFFHEVFNWPAERTCIRFGEKTLGAKRKKCKQIRTSGQILLNKQVLEDVELNINAV